MPKDSKDPTDSQEKSRTGCTALRDDRGCPGDAGEDAREDATEQGTEDATEGGTEDATEDASDMEICEHVESVVKDRLPVGKQVGAKMGQMDEMCEQHDQRDQNGDFLKCRNFLK